MIMAVEANTMNIESAAAPAMRYSINAHGNATTEESIQYLLHWLWTHGPNEDARAPAALKSLAPVDDYEQQFIVVTEGEGLESVRVHEIAESSAVTAVLLQALQELDWFTGPLRHAWQCQGFFYIDSAAPVARNVELRALQMMSALQGPSIDNVEIHCSNRFLQECIEQLQWRTSGTARIELEGTGGEISPISVVHSLLLRLPEMMPSAVYSDDHEHMISLSFTGGSNVLVADGHELVAAYIAMIKHQILRVASMPKHEGAPVNFDVRGVGMTDSAAEGVAQSILHWLPTQDHLRHYKVHRESPMCVSVEIIIVEGKDEREVRFWAGDTLFMHVNRM